MEDLDLLRNKNMLRKHEIISVNKDSIAGRLGISSGDFLVSINGKDIEDILDYQFICHDEKIEIVIEKDGDIREYTVEKDEDEDIGLDFGEGLMDKYHSCCNKCIFCFIDQMPKGMRETLYFKDDDMRLSFLQGNYVTLTNMSDHDIDRIINYRMEPVNISFQTTNPELRCKMLNNRFAGDALKKADRLFEAGIKMNGQIVLCKGVNDGGELERSISDLFKYLPIIESVSVVPVGLSKYRDGLYPLEPFTKEDAEAVIDCIERWQNKAFEKFGTHFVHASDEWYVIAERDLPSEDSYDGYLQIENGVGMLRSLMEEYDYYISILEDALEYKPNILDRISQKSIENKTGIRKLFDIKKLIQKGREVSCVTGMISYPYIKKLSDDFCTRFPGYKVNVYPIRNDFFGERITVTGLITGQDIIAQLKGKDLGDELLLPENMFRMNTTVFLDDVTLEDIEKSLLLKGRIVKSNGVNFIESIIGEAFYV